jgi:hypothetical protein
MGEPPEVLYALPRPTGRIVLVSAICAAAVGNVIAALELTGHGSLTGWFVGTLVTAGIATAPVRGGLLARQRS